MIKGIYKAASGMIPRLKKQEIAANNIANASTPGFKRDSVFVKELNAAQQSLMPKRSSWETPMIDQVYTDYSQGTFNRTGNPLDVALEGEGFFVLQSFDGNDMLYTRNGNFSINTEGFLVNSEGYQVLGDGGPVEVTGGTVAINESGELLVDGQTTGRLQVVDIPDKEALVKAGDSSFTVDETVETVPASGYSVRQGYLEGANINVVKEMVEMIITMRGFETAAKTLQTQDESLETLLQEVGKTRI